VEEA
jgi:hypothetical protein